MIGAALPPSESAAASPWRDGVHGQMSVLHGLPGAEQHSLQHSEERGTAAAAAAARGDQPAAAAARASGGPGPLRAGARLLVRYAEARGPPEPAGRLQGGFGRVGEDAALRQERALLSGAAPGRAAGAGAQLLGSAARAGAGPGSSALRDGGDHGAQHAPQDTDQQALQR